MDAVIISPHASILDVRYQTAGYGEILTDVIALRIFPATFQRKQNFSTVRMFRSITWQIYTDS